MAAGQVETAYHLELGDKLGKVQTQARFKWNATETQLRLYN